MRGVALLTNFFSPSLFLSFYFYFFLFVYFVLAFPSASV